VAIANIRDANPQRGYSYVGSEATSKVNKRDENGEFQICEDEDVAQDLEDVKVSFCSPGLLIQGIQLGSCRSIRTDNDAPFSPIGTL